MQTKEGCVKIVDAVKSQESHVDTLVNCAGVNSPWRVHANDHNDGETLASLKIF